VVVEDALYESSNKVTGKDGKRPRENEQAESESGFSLTKSPRPTWRV
jgi:hypothetical protein